MPDPPKHTHAHHEGCYNKRLTCGREEHQHDPGSCYKSFKGFPSLRCSKDVHSHDAHCYAHDKICGHP